MKEKCEVTKSEEQYPLIKRELLKRAASGAPKPKADSPFGRALQALTEPAHDDYTEMLDKLEQYLQDHSADADDLF